MYSLSFIHQPYLPMNITGISYENSMIIIEDYESIIVLDF